MCDGKKAAAAGKAKPNEPVDASKSSCPTKKKGQKKIQYIMLKSVSFLSDHNLIKDNEADYRNTGNLYPRQHWTPKRSVPISHTSDKPIEVELEYEVGPSGAVAETGKLVCKDDRGDLWFVKENINFSPGKAKLRLKSAGFTKFIESDNYMLQWSIENMEVGPSPSATFHRVAFTVDSPEGYTGDTEPGVTARRVFRSADLVHSMNSVDSHTVVKGLMTKLGAYVLQPDPSVPPEYGHPTYYRNMGSNNWGGAWPMMDYLGAYGECQAIVRFVGNVIKQLGMPGSMDMVYVFARPDSPSVAAEDKKGGLAFYPGYTLADQEVIINKVYPPSHSRYQGGGTSPGFNNFEACLKFTDSGKTKYYGGGTQGADHDTAQQVLTSFFALVKVEPAWFPDDTHPRRVMGLKIVQILAKQKDW
jgi:hypothetical protein